MDAVWLLPAGAELRLEVISFFFCINFPDRCAQTITLSYWLICKQLVLMSPDSWIGVSRQPVQEEVTFKSLFVLLSYLFSQGEREEGREEAGCRMVRSEGFEDREIEVRILALAP